MPRIVFTSNLQRHVDCPERDVAGATVRAALEAVFAGAPALRGYILDDQGRLRRHIAVFADGELVRAGDGLDQAIEPATEIHVMQALSGGEKGYP